MRVERDGWFIDIETLDVSARPHWEIRCDIRRKRENVEERRGHRFTVSDELSSRFKLASLAPGDRERLMTQAAKRVILREMDAIFEEPEEGLDSVRPLSDGDFG